MVKIKKKVDFTSGTILPKIIAFILPVMATNLLQVFYSAADMMIVSMSGVKNAIGAIGTTSSFVNLITNVLIGFSVGANVIVARYVGSKDRENAQKAVHTAILLSFFIGIFGTVLGVIVSRPIIAMMGNSGNLLDLAVLYTTIYFIGCPFIAATNFLIAIFRAKGDSKTPLIILSSAGVVNIVLNFFFVNVCSLSVEGVAIATVIANVTSTVWLIIKLAKDDDYTKFSFKQLKFNKRALRDIIIIGLPAGIQGSLFSISNMLIQSSVVSVNNAMCPAGSEFQPVVSGSAAGGNLEGFVYTAMNSVYHGAITFTSQNLGAKKNDRLNKILYYCLGVSSVIWIVMTLIMYVLRTPLLSLYGVVPGEVGSLDRMAYDAAIDRLNVLCWTYFLCGYMEVCSGVLRGLGKSLTSTINTLVGTCVLRVFWILVIFPIKPTLITIFISYPLSWLLTSSVSFGCIMYSLHKIKVKDKEKLLVENN